MRLMRCKHGHAYDADLYWNCPGCEREGRLFPEPSSEPCMNHPFFPTDDDVATVPMWTYDGYERPDRASLPEEIKDLEFLNLLGKGSAGKVWEVQKRLRFAMKVIPWNTETARLKAKHEYEVGSVFRGEKQIIRYEAYYEKEACSYILQEIAVPCLKWLVEKPATVQDVLHVVLQTAEALKMIHAHGYTHFDIKPINLFYDGEVVKIGDFSHCLAMHLGEEHHHPVGTWLYMAPEIANGGNYSGREDLYSLGMTLLALLTGGVFPMNVSGRRPPVRNRDDSLNSFFLQREMTEIISKAAAYDPQDRYADLNDFQEAITQFMQEHPEWMDEAVPAYLPEDRLLAMYRPTVGVDDPHYLDTYDRSYEDSVIGAPMEN